MNRSAVLALGLLAASLLVAVACGSDEASCGDTQADPANCGSCGHDCVGGACTAGVCQPLALTIAIGPPPTSSIGWTHPRRIVTDGTTVYFTRTNSIYRVAATGGMLSTLVTTATAPQGIARDASHVYYALTTSIRSVSLVGDAGLGGIVGAGQIAAAGVAVDDTSAFWVAGGSVMQAPLAGGRGTPLAAGLSDPYAIALDAVNVYWTDFGSGRVAAAIPDGSVMSIPKAGGAPVTLASGRAGPYDIAANAGGVYWIEVGINESDGAVMMVPSGGGAPVTLASAQDHVGGIAVDEANVYFTAAGSVWKMPASGGTPVALASGQNNPRAITLDQTSVYWVTLGTAGASYSDGTVMRVAK